MDTTEGVARCFYQLKEAGNMVKKMGDKTMMQILEMFSDGKSYSLEAVAKLYRVGSNRCYKFGKNLNLESSARGS